MIFEYRVNHEMESVPLNVVLGSEGCVYITLYDLKHAIVNLNKYKNSKIRILTPIIPEKYMTRLVMLLKELSSKMEIKVTINDWGLYYLLKGVTSITMVIGRCLTKSIIDCPWYSELFKYESEKIKDGILNYSYHHLSKKALLDSCGVVELEVNCCDFEKLKRLKDLGYLISCHKDGNLISMGRMCYEAKWNNINITDCVSKPRCEQEIAIELYKKWDKKTLMFSDDTSILRSYYNDMFFRGCALIKKDNDFFYKCKSQIDFCIV